LLSVETASFNAAVASATRWFANSCALAASSKCFSSGSNVGINTSSPIAKLQVTYLGADSNSVKIVGTGGSTNGNFFYSLATDYSDTFPLNIFATNHGNPARTNNLVRIHSNETTDGSLPLRVTAQGSIASPTYEALAVNYLGNVGIGTTSPSDKIDVLGAGAQFLKIANTGTYLMRFGIDSSNNGFIGSSNATPIGFHTNGVNRLTISTAGDVQIGTTAYATVGGSGYLMVKNVIGIVTDNTANTNNRN